MVDSAKREEWKKFLEEFQGEPDRSCAILGTAFLDEQLRALLEAFFLDDPKRIPEMFEAATGPFSTFSGRIQTAYALGFLAPSELRDLDLIRKIRNEFAHDLHGVTFSTPSVVARCTELTRCNFLQKAVGELTARDRYILRVTFLANWIALRRLGIGDSRRKVQAEVKTA
jgi:mannitol operon repressor